jgi:hypothetical protein
MSWLQNRMAPNPPPRGAPASDPYGKSSLGSYQGAANHGYPHFGWPNSQVPGPMAAPKPAPARDSKVYRPFELPPWSPK